MMPSILVVDKTRSVLRALIGEFGNHSVEAIGTKSFDQALECLEQNAIRLLIADPHEMTGSGERFVDVARQLRPSMKIILISKDDFGPQKEQLSKEEILEKIFLVPYTMEKVLSMSQKKLYCQSDIDELFK